MTEQLKGDEHSQRPEAKSQPLAKKYKIIYDRKDCIGATMCAAVNPDDWEIIEDGKAKLIKGTEEPKGSQQWVRIINESELKRNLKAAESCPVKVIKIIDLQTGKTLYP